MYRHLGSKMAWPVAGLCAATRTSARLCNNKGAFVRRAYATKKPQFSFMNTPRDLAEYFLGVSMGLAAGWILWAKSNLDILNRPNTQPAAAALTSPFTETIPADPNIFTVVLTGGPCGGKSSAMEHISKQFKEKGFDVYVVPETPTLMFNAGVRPISTMTPQQLWVFERQVLTNQIKLENSVIQVAHSMNKPAVILLDRGALDIAAYLPYHTWKKLLEEVGIDERSLRQRYNAVLHLVTAADGAEQFYTRSNNHARTEDITLARELDGKVRQAWVAHDNVAVFDNSTDFQDKLKRVTEWLQRFVAERREGKGQESKEKELR